MFFKKDSKTVKTISALQKVILGPLKKYSSRDTIPAGNRNWHQPELGTNQKEAESATLEVK